MSVVQLFINDKMAMVGHLINSDTLAFEKKLGLETEEDLSKPWRAMVLKDSDGDVAVIVAEWVGKVNGVPGVRGRRGQPGNETFYLIDTRPRI